VESIITGIGLILSIQKTPAENPYDRNRAAGLLYELIERELQKIGRLKTFFREERKFF